MNDNLFVNMRYHVHYIYSQNMDIGKITNGTDSSINIG